MSRILYKGFSNINSNSTDSGAIYELDVIKQDIINLCMCRKGSFPGDVRRGLLINDYVFQPVLNEYERGLIISDAVEQLEVDPRYDVISVDISHDNDEQRLLLLIKIMVHPFDHDVDLNIPYRTE